MKYIKLFISIALLLIIGYLYNKYNTSLEKDKQFEDFELVRKFLLGESKEIEQLKNSKKPILWIPINYEKNSRSWDSFFSRSNNNLNLPYYYFTLKSIILKNNKDFNICIIDDSTICKLLSRNEFDFNLEALSDPIKKNVRLLGLTKILNKFGGLIIPPSFLCFKSLNNINNIINNDIIVFGENKNNSVSYNDYPYIPDYKIIASNKNNNQLNLFIEYLNNLINKDKTDESVFNGNINNYLLSKLRQNNIVTIKSHFLGLQDLHHKDINLESLFDNELIEFNEFAYGLYIQDDIILKRYNYNWFCYLSINEILNSEFILAKLLILHSSN